MKIRLCTKCVNPETRPNMELDQHGICPVCNFEGNKKEQAIDWKERHDEILSICQWGKENTRSTYDCIIPVSGGKDSTRQACYARDVLNMNPLLVSCLYPPEQLQERGSDNLSNLISLGFDTLTLTLNPQLWKCLMREGFFRFGNWAKSTEMALYAIPIHAAIAYQIPLILYGENPAFTIGETESKLDGDASRMKCGNTIAGGPASLLPDNITQKDCHFYYYPSDDDMEAANLRLIYLGYYMEDWSGKNNAEFAIARGLTVREEPPEMIGDIFGFSCLDEDYSIVNQFLKYLKLGYGRVCDQVCEAISTCGMDRDKGLELLKKYDGRCDISFIKRFCAYIEIPEQRFWEVAEKFRNLDIWKKNHEGEWMLQMEEIG